MNVAGIKTIRAKAFEQRRNSEKFAHDFALSPDKPPANAIALLPPKRGLTDEQWADQMNSGQTSPTACGC